jgi:hypothetical protein
MTPDARGIRQHAAAEVTTRSDPGAAYRAAEHRKHLMESRQALGRA